MNSIKEEKTELQAALLLDLQDFNIKKEDKQEILIDR